MHITIVSSESGDWSGVYFRSTLVTEDHSVRYDELLDELIKANESVKSYEHLTVSDEWIEENDGSFPLIIDEIPEYAWI